MQQRKQQRMERQLCQVYAAKSEFSNFVIPSSKKEFNFSRSRNEAFRGIVVFGATG